MLTLSLTGTLAKSITPTYGITDQDWTGLKTPMQHHTEKWLEERKKGEHAWSMDPYNRRMAERVKEIVKKVKRMKIQTVVWIGIGGSSLGPQVLQEAFETPQTVEFIILDTIDPSILALTLSILDWKRTLVVVVSKSGNTLESMSVFYLLWEKLQKTRGIRAAQRVIGITDGKKGPLHSFCENEGVEMLPIPRDTGGRYCIFTPVGLLPLALLGGDIDAFLRGAKDMDTQCQNTHLQENPAAQLAAAQYLLELKRGCVIRVIMPYIQRLRSIARWNQQLIAESLGKDEAHNPIPLAAIGTQDQHSLLQQWMAGPRKAWHLFIGETEKPDLRVPKDIDSSFAFIAGKNFGELLDACEQGTTKALRSAKRPTASITLSRTDEYHIGQLFFLLMAEVVFLGKLYRIDPYGQPAVEIGKTMTKELLSGSR